MRIKQLSVRTIDFITRKNGDQFLDKKLSNPVDAYVGSRIKLRRTMCALSQVRLGNALGLTFQQVQKYESSVNRVSASRLFELSRVLMVPVTYFFDEMPQVISDTAVSGPAERVPSSSTCEKTPALPEDQIFAKQETLEMVRAYYNISDQTIRRRMLDLINSLAPAKSDALDIKAPHSEKV